MSYGIYLIFVAILTGFISLMTAAKLGMKAKFVFLVIGMGLFLTIAVASMQ